MKLYDIAYEPMEIITGAAWPIPVLVAAVAIAAAVLILVLRRRRKSGKDVHPKEKR